jgi:hypothetical protein
MYFCSRRNYLIFLLSGSRGHQQEIIIIIQQPTLCWCRFLYAQSKIVTVTAKPVYRFPAAKAFGDGAGASKSLYSVRNDFTGLAIAAFIP